MAKKKTSGKTKTAKKKTTSKPITVGKVYTTKSQLSYKKKLTKKESKKYSTLEKKAKAVKSKADKKLRKQEKKLKKGGLTKAEKNKLKKAKASAKKKVLKSKAVKALNTYKKKLDKKYTKKRSGASKAVIKVENKIEDKKDVVVDTKDTIKSKAKNRAYLINNATNNVLIFQFNPTKVPYERKVSYNSIDAPGQAYPQTQFAKGEALEFTVELFMYTSLVRKKVSTVSQRGVYSGSSVDSWATKEVTGAVAADNKIDEARQFLQELIPPYSNKDFGMPPTCTFAFGYFVHNCVITGLKVEDERLDSEGKPVQTKFTITFRKV